MSNSQAFIHETCLLKQRGIICDSGDDISYYPHHTTWYRSHYFKSLNIGLEAGGIVGKKKDFAYLPDIENYCEPRNSQGEDDC